MGEGRHDLARTFVAPLRRLDHAQVEDAIAGLVASARSLLPPERGPETEIALDVDLRYAGQAYELTVPAPAPRIAPSDIAELEERFRAAHRAAFGHAWTPRRSSS